MCPSRLVTKSLFTELLFTNLYRFSVGQKSVQVSCHYISYDFPPRLVSLKQAAFSDRFQTLQKTGMALLQLHYSTSQSHCH